MLNSKTRWKYPAYTEEDISYLQEELHVSPLVAKLFQARGWTNIEEAKRILHTKDQEFHDPYLLHGMTEAVERIKQALHLREKIRIYGDYDCDGVSSTTLMIHVLRELDASFDYYIPDRFTEGYGLNDAALDKAKEEGIQLIITVDTGISAKDQIAYGTDLGLDFIVTDHHEPSAELPECVAVINPKQETCTYPYPYLAGVGVAFKVGQALLERIPYELLDIATIGTIADLVPLTGENRLIAFHGLKALNQTKHMGLEALLETAGLTDQIVDEQHIGFAIGPRINASGRIEKADKAVQLLISTDRTEALQLADEIDQLNRRRQGLVDETAKEAIEWVEDTYGQNIPSCLVVAKEGWNVGVIGIVASRLINRFYVPTIVLSIDQEKGLAKGSARSIEGFDIYQALRECADLLPHFGGHPMAAGMTLPVENVDLLRQQLIEIANEQLTEEDFIPATHVDLCCKAEDVTLEAMEDLATLSPFGVGNPKPVFLLEQLKFKECRPVGADGSHLKCQVEQEGYFLDGIGFGWGEVAHKISMEAKVDLVGELSMNEWNGQKKPQIMIQDIRVSEQQFFDWRGVKQLQKKWGQLVFDEHVAVCLCRPENQFPRDVPDYIQPILFDEQGSILSGPASVTEIDTFIIYDLPQTFAQCKQIFQQIKHGKRFYFIFQQQEEHYFSSIPSRENFKWYYAFLKKQGSFHVQREGEKLAGYKGWTLDSIQFMTDVFLELQFVKLQNGGVFLQDNPAKSDLTSSKLFQQKQEEIELEKELVYSTYTDLRNVLEAWMMEEKKSGALTASLSTGC